MNGLLSRTINSPTTTPSTVPLHRVDYPLKVCAMIDCRNREILNTNCDFVQGRGRFGCYNVEENVCTPLASRKFCYRSMNKDMSYILVNRTSQQPAKYTLYTFKDSKCTKPEGYDKPITADCQKNNIITGEYACVGQKSPLGLMCKSKQLIYNPTVTQVKQERGNAVRNDCGSLHTMLMALCVLMILLLQF